MLARYGYKDRYVFFLNDLLERQTEEKPHTYIIEANGIIFCHTGKMQVLVEGTEYTMEPEDVLLVRDAESHAITILEYPCEYSKAYFSLHYFYVFDPQYRMIRPFADRPLGVNNLIRGSRINSALLRSCFQSIVQVPDVYMRRIAVMGALTMALSEINRVYDPAAVATCDTRPELTQKIINQINERFTGHLDPDEIAAGLYISRSQFDRIIKQATGVTLWHYVTTKRLIHARHLLHEGVMIKEAAARSGFSDYSTFYKAYIKWNDTPPKIERPNDESDPMLRHFYQPDDSSMMF